MLKTDNRYKLNFRNRPLGVCSFLLEWDELMFIGESSRQERSIFKVFVRLFQKAAQSRARSPCRRPQTAKFLIVRKRHRRVNAKPKAWQRGTAQVGGSPFVAKTILIVCPLFSLVPKAQRKKLGKKEHAVELFRRVRAATTAPRVGLAVAF